MSARQIYEEIQCATQDVDNGIEFCDKIIGLLDQYMGEAQALFYNPNDFNRYLISAQTEYISIKKELAQALKELNQVLKMLPQK